MSALALPRVLQCFRMLSVLLKWKKGNKLELECEMSICRVEKPQYEEWWGPACSPTPRGTPALPPALDRAPLQPQPRPCSWASLPRRGSCILTGSRRRSPRHRAALTGAAQLIRVDNGGKGRNLRPNCCRNHELGLEAIQLNWEEA